VLQVMHTIVTPVGGGDARQVDSRTFTILHRDESGRWRVARVVPVGTARAHGDTDGCAIC